MPQSQKEKYKKSTKFLLWIVSSWVLNILYFHIALKRKIVFLKNVLCNQSRIKFTD